MHWSRFEKRLEIGTRHTLALLDEYGIRATFFVLGWVADAMPELVREVGERGHEIASKGYLHRNIREMAPDVFRDDLARAREALEGASGRPVRGYRVADGRFGLADLWALDVLAEEGYAYDSSIRPIFREYASEPWRRFAHDTDTATSAFGSFRHPHSISLASICRSRAAITSGNSPTLSSNAPSPTGTAPMRRPS